jgi:hypothetical protein
MMFAESREILTVSKRTTQNFCVDRFNLKKLNEVRVRGE